MNIRNIVLNRLEQAVAEHSPMTFPEEMDDDTELDMFGLDSLAFMGLHLLFIVLCWCLDVFIGFTLVFIGCVSVLYVFI